MKSSAETLEQIRREVIIAVVREESAEAAEEVARAYVENGLHVIEITFTTPGAAGLIQDLSTLYAPIGITFAAGSLRTSRQAAEAHRAGANILVSPHTQPEVIAYAKEHDLVSVAGASTPTEIIHAWELGASIIKLYPAGLLGGPDYIRTIRQPIRDVRMLAGGPVAIEEIDAYLDAGVVAVNMAGSLAPRELVDAKDWNGIGQRIAQAKSIVDARFSE